MDRNAPYSSNKASGSSLPDGLDKYPDYDNFESVVVRRHRRNASNNSTGAAIRIRPYVTPRPRVVRETSPHSSASAPLHDTSSIPRSNEYMRRLSGIAKTFSSPNLHPSDGRIEDRPSSSPGAQPPSNPLLRANTTPSIPRLSPSQKRKPPASHSSYGIETSNGPPPSYSTQQTLSQERTWSQERGRSQKPVTLNSTSSDDISPRPTIIHQVTAPEIYNPESAPENVTGRPGNASGVTKSTTGATHLPDNSSSLAGDLRELETQSSAPPSQPRYLAASSR